MRRTVVFLAALLAPPALADTVLEPGFQIETYVSGLTAPTGIAFAPDGRMFVTEQTGRVRVVENGVLREAPFAELEVYYEAESGLLSVVLDPNFVGNGYIYLFATTAADEQKIYRANASGETATDLVVIRDRLPSNGLFHNGGGLEFGPDGKLYFSVGDVGQPELSQNSTTYAGKVCRINADGSTPTDNPFKTPTHAPSAIYAKGFRNPFRIAFAPDGRLFVMDVGSSDDVRREEINLVGPGDNCGWPYVEGYAAGGEPNGLTDPIYAYHDEGQSITGVVVYTGKQFPEVFAGDLFHLDYISKALFWVPLSSKSTVLEHRMILQSDSGPVDLAQGLDGALYFCETFSGNIKRVTFDLNAAPPERPIDDTLEPNAPNDPNDPGDPNAPASDDATNDTADATGASASAVVCPVTGFATLFTLALVSLHPVRSRPRRCRG